MAGPNGASGDGLAMLRAALERVPAVRVRDEGASDPDGWWHIGMFIDRDHPGAWGAVAVLAKVFNTDRHEAGSAIFKPSAALGSGDEREDVILWSLSHRFGDFTPEFAAGALTRQMAELNGADRAEE